MKNLFIFAITIISSCLVACGNKTDSSLTADSDSVDIDSIAELVPIAKLQTEEIKDSLKLGKWEFKADVDYPVEGPDALVKSIEDWIAEVMTSSAGEEPLKTYSGNKADGKAVIDYYAHAFMKSINYDDYVDLPDDITCSSEYTIKPEYENDSIITYSFQYSIYSGGAHGGYVTNGVSFRKRDGKRLGWNMISSKKALLPEIKKGLKEYFEVKKDAELSEHLQITDKEGNFCSDVNKIPLPQTEPWIDGKGLNFIYQQYEIACYADGMPGFIIQKSRMSKYLTKEVQSLIQ